ncbi:putative capsid protein [Linepithema humile polycipivirus 1]|nr:putative capsid [Linepithema humile polycipivirus 1]UXD80038.1 putative capsid protein [Linepithema humile polycipivirus 1]
MEQLTNAQQTIKSRAKEIDDGLPPLPMENVLLGLPYKPNSEIMDEGSAVSQKWSFAEVLAQKKLIADIPVNASTTGEIWRYRNTWSNVINQHFRNLKDLFLLKSWNLNFIIEFRSNFQQVGQFILAYSNCPQNLVEYLTLENDAKSYQLQTQLPHRKIFMGEDQNVIVQLKWLSPHKSAIYSPLMNFNDKGVGPDNIPPIQDDYDMGFLTLSIPFQMEVAPSVVADMNVRIWSYVTDLQYSGYAPNDAII